VLHISPVGEVLRARLPNDIILVNDALTGLRAPPPEKE
jgi:hypothetical protein